MTVLHDLNSDNIMTYLAYCTISTYGELSSKHKNIPDHKISTYGELSSKHKNIPDHKIQILWNVTLSHLCEQFMTFQRIIMLHLPNQAFP